MIIKSLRLATYNMEKTSTTLIALTTLVAGFTGGQVIDNSTIDKLGADITAVQEELVKAETDLEIVTSEKDSAINSKRKILKDWIEVQSRFPEKPTYDLTYASIEEGSEALAELIMEKGLEKEALDNGNVFEVLKDYQSKQGLICK